MEWDHSRCPLVKSLSGFGNCGGSAKLIAARSKLQCTLVKNCTLELNMDRAADVDGILYSIGDAAREARFGMYVRR